MNAEGQATSATERNGADIWILALINAWPAICRMSRSKLELPIRTVQFTSELEAICEPSRKKKKRFETI